MPWKEVNQIDLKIQLITEWNRGYFSITDLSQKYGFSRPTVYEQFGIEGLKEQSRAPKRRPHRISEEILDLGIQEKLKNRKRGPRKIRAQLKRKYPKRKFPAVSTMAYWLKKQGPVEQRKKRLHVAPYTEPFSECHASNAIWSIDYKGQFSMKDGDICYPLTLSDDFSRLIVACQALEAPRYDPKRRCLESVFREYGLPRAIRSDTGTPFAGR